jgi:hypothetical protein
MCFILSDAKEKEIKEKNKRFQFQARQAVEVEEDYDESGRPKMKVALLHGPPGKFHSSCLRFQCISSF